MDETNIFLVFIGITLLIIGLGGLVFIYLKARRNQAELEKVEEKVYRQTDLPKEVADEPK